MNTEPPASVLVVDDDENQRWMLKKYLQKHGFEVNTAEDGQAMRETLSEHGANIVLLDVTLPGEDGFSLARYLREHHQVGIIMLTASDELLDRILGLEIGADDYVTKPFEPRELLARVKSVLRRILGPQSTDLKRAVSEKTVLCHFGDFTLDLDAQELRDRDHKLIGITAMEFDLLKTFASNPGRVLSRETLLDIAHKSDTYPFDRSIDIRIARVRRKIEKDPSKPLLIKTVRGAGYMFADPARR